MLAHSLATPGDVVLAIRSFRNNVFVFANWWISYGSGLHVSRRSNRSIRGRQRFRDAIRGSDERFCNSGTSRYSDVGDGVLGFE